MTPSQAGPGHRTSGRSQLADALQYAGVTVVGLAIGAWIGLATRAPVRPTTAIVTSVARPAVAVVPAALPAAVVTTSRAARGAGWRIDEANAQVGMIVWSGYVERADGTTIVLALHKESVAGRSATPCERQTALHAPLQVGAPQQTVPYEEVNCYGATQTGELRVVSFSPAGDAFRGSFWRDGAKLGDVTARRE